MKDIPEWVFAAQIDLFDLFCLEARNEVNIRYDIRSIFASRERYVYRWAANARERSWQSRNAHESVHICVPPEQRDYAAAAGKLPAELVFFFWNTHPHHSLSFFFCNSVITVYNLPLLLVHFLLIEFFEKLRRNDLQRSEEMVSFEANKEKYHWNWSNWFVKKCNFAFALNKCCERYYSFLSHAYLRALPSHTPCNIRIFCTFLMASATGSEFLKVILGCFGDAKSVFFFLQFDWTKSAFLLTETKQEVNHQNIFYSILYHIWFWKCSMSS